MLHVGVALDAGLLDAHAISRAVTALAALRRGTIDLYELRIIYVGSESAFYGLQVCPVAVRRELDAVGNSLREIVDEPFGAFTVPAADEPRRDAPGFLSMRIPSVSTVPLAVITACALTETNDLGQFIAASVEAPLSAIMGSSYKVSAFSFHLNKMTGSERGNVLLKTGARRTFQYHSTEAAMQPYILMKSLDDKVISKENFDCFYVRR